MDTTPFFWRASLGSLPWKSIRANAWAISIWARTNLLKRSYAKGLAGSWKTWPPLPGSYRVLRYHAPVAVCTLNSDELIEPLASTKLVSSQTFESRVAANMIRSGYEHEASGIHSQRERSRRA